MSADPDPASAPPLFVVLSVMGAHLGTDAESEMNERSGPVVPPIVRSVRASRGGSGQAEVTCW
jgi:hypothetical protein